jgi:hypothetical protein
MLVGVALSAHVVLSTDLSVRVGHGSIHAVDLFRGFLDVMGVVCRLVQREDFLSNLIYGHRIHVTWIVKVSGIIIKHSGVTLLVVVKHAVEV